MPITLTCPNCDASLDAPDDIAGRKVQCNKCGEKFRAPGSKSRSRHAAGNEDQDERSSRRTDKASRRRERDDQDDRDEGKDRARRGSRDAEDEPPERKKKGKKKKKAVSPVTRLILIGVGVLLLIAGIGAWYSFSGDKSDGSANKGGPVTGPGGTGEGGASAGDPNLPGWLEFADPNGQYKVRLPRMPAAPTKQLWPLPNGEQAEATMYTVEIGGGMYSVAQLLVPGREAGAPADPLLDDTVSRGTAWFKGAVIKNQANITHQGFPGRQAVLEYKGGKGSTVVRVILAGNRMFWVVANGDNFAVDTPKVKGFFDSLKIN